MSSCFRGCIFETPLESRGEPGTPRSARPRAGRREPLRTRNLTQQVKFRGSQVTYSGPRPRWAGGPIELDLGDVTGLRTFGTVNDLELDRLTFLE